MSISAIYYKPDSVSAPHLLGKATGGLCTDAGQQHSCGIHQALCYHFGSTNNRFRDGFSDPGKRSMYVSDWDTRLHNGHHTMPFHPPQLVLVRTLMLCSATTRAGWLCNTCTTGMGSVT